MDQDDKQGGKSAEFTAKDTNGIVDGAVIELDDSSTTFDALTHSRSEVAAGNNVDTNPAEIHTTEAITVGPEVEPTTTALSPDDSSPGAQVQPPEDASSL